MAIARSVFEVTTGCGDFKSLDREQERALLMGAWKGGGLQAPQDNAVQAANIAFPQQAPGKCNVRSEFDGFPPCLSRKKLSRASLEGPENLRWGLGSSRA